MTNRTFLNIPWKESTEFVSLKVLYGNKHEWSNQGLHAPSFNRDYFVDLNGIFRALGKTNIFEADVSKDVLNLTWVGGIIYGA